MKNSHESVETPKGFVLGRMGSLVFEPPPHFLASLKRNIVRITSTIRIKLKKIRGYRKNLNSDENKNFETVPECRKFKRWPFGFL